MNHTTRPRIIFVTGTDTGVGKTVLTGLLLSHLRQTGCRALALKPFCSGTRDDAKLLGKLQDGELTLDEVNPFFFPEPIAPLVALRTQRRQIPLREVLEEVRSVASRHLGGALARTSAKPGRPTRAPETFLLVEGSGGLLVPLGEGSAGSAASRRSEGTKTYMVLELMAGLNCEAIVVARNRLGTINHSLLTVRVLRESGIPSVKLALMESAKQDISSRSNAQVLAELLAPVPVHVVPFLGPNCRKPATISAAATRLRRVLGRLSSRR